MIAAAAFCRKFPFFCFLSKVSFSVKHPYLGIKPRGNNQKLSAMVLCGTEQTSPWFPSYYTVCIQNVCKSVSKSMWVNVFCSVFILYLKDEMTWKAWWVKMKKKKPNQNTTMQVFCFLFVHRANFEFLQKDRASFFLSDSHRCCIVEREEEKGSSHWSLTWTALLKRLWCDWHLSPLCLRHSN